MGSTNSGAMCTGAAGEVCSRIWLQHYYRSDLETGKAMDEVECQGMTLALSRYYQVRTQTTTGRITPYTPAMAIEYCSRSGPVNPLMLSYFTP